MNTTKKPIPTWSNRDEQVFQELHERRTRWNDVHRKKLSIALEKVIPSPLTEMLIEAFISGAMEIRDALAPFDSGERSPAASEG